MASIKLRKQKDGTTSYLITVSLGRDKTTNKQILKTVTYTPKENISDLSYMEWSRLYGRKGSDEE